MSDRPFGVTIIALVQLLSSLATLYAGQLILMGFADVGAPFSPSEIFTFGILTLILGAIGVLLSYGLFTLKPWAWVGTIILQGLAILLNLVSGVSTSRGGEIGALIISLVIIYYLYTPAVKGTFRQR